MTEIVYSQSRHPEMTEGRLFQNPRMFTGVHPDADTAIVVGDFPHIVKAYRDAGKEVREPLKETALAETATVIAERGALTDEERRALAIPDDWRELAWTQRAGDGEGLTLRGLASALSDEPVSNKTQATAVIEAELARRGQTV